VISAIVFDLDNCLAPADAMGRDFLEPMFAAIRRANNGTVPDAMLDRAFEDCWRLALDVVAKKYGFTDAMLDAGWHVGQRLAVRGPMNGYADLPELAHLPAKLFIVTSGFRRMQESKIDALGFRAMFAGVYVDAIDEPGRKGKDGLFREILDQHWLDPRTVLAVGDNPDSEIDAGKQLGMATAQILRPGIARGTNATHYVRDLNELRRILD
jgi:putative hydrolase of the HAD superfamily